MTDIARDTTTSPRRSAPRSSAGTAPRCSVTSRRRSTSGCPNAEDVKQGLIAYRIAAHAADLARGSKRAARGTANCPRLASRFDWNRQFELSLDPETARRDARRDARRRLLQDRRVLLDVRPKYCPMHNFKDVDWDELRAVIAHRKHERTLTAH